MTGEEAERASGTKGAEAVAVVIASPAVMTGAAGGGAPEMRAVAPVIKPPLTYTQKVMIAVGIAGSAIVLGMLLYTVAHVVVLCFAGLLFAVFLSAPSDLLAKYTRIPRGYALLMVLAALAILVVGGGYLVGRTVARQTRDLSRTLPEALRQLKNDLESRFPAEPAETEPAASAPATGEAAQTMPVVVTASRPAAARSHWLAEKLTQVWDGASEFFSSESFMQSAGGVAGNVVTRTFGVVGNMIVIFGVGLFFSLNPKMYARGLVKLSPLSRRTRFEEILAKVGSQLEWWFVGQFCSMVAVGTLTFIGLSILHVPMAATLAILAALMNFIPNFGPIIAGAPAVLIAFAPQGDQATLRPALAGWVILMYTAIQYFDGFVMTPYFQQRTVKLPPALIVVAQVVFATLLGPMGLILATPMLVAVLALVRMVYVEDVLGDMEK